MAEALTPTEAELAQGLRRVLAPELGAQGEQLARALAAVLAGRAAGERLAVDEAAALVQGLAGRSVTAGQAVVSFGAGGQLGDVTIGDVAAGNIIKLYIQPGPGGLELGAPAYSDAEEARHRLALIDIHRRRLRILEQQAALFGAHCPPHILIEIDEIGAKIAQLAGQGGR